MKKFISILVVLLVSCNPKTDQKPKGEYSVEAINKATSKNVLSVESKVSFVQLETNEDCLLDNIINIEVTAERIYVLDRQSFYLFSRDGWFLKKIKRGRGPGELTRAINFSLDMKHKRIFIIEQGNVLHMYDLEAKYIETHILPGSYADALRIDEENVLLHTALPSKYEDHLVSVYNLESNKITKKYILAANLPMKDISILTFNNFVDSDDGLFYSASNSRTLYQYSDGDMIPLYSIDFKKLTPPESYVNNFDQGGEFMNHAHEDNYIGFINYCFHFETFSLIGLKYKAFNCGIIYRDNPSELFFSTISDLFQLPNTPSFIIPSNANRNQLFFVYYNDILMEEGMTNERAILELGENRITVEKNANPLLITVTLEN